MSQKKRFKRISSLLCAVILAFTVAFSVPVASSAVSSAPARSSTLNKASNRPKLSATSKKIYYKATYTLKLLNNKKSVKWSTSNAKVAKVSSKGVVTGVGLGSAYIYAKVGSKTYKCKITVIDRNLKASVSFKVKNGGYFINKVSTATAAFQVKNYDCAKASAYIVNSEGKSVYSKVFNNVKKNKQYSFSWDGKNTKGNYVPAGSYRVLIRIGDGKAYSSYLSVKSKNDFAGGNGSASNPFLVSSASQLRLIVKYPNAYFKQTKDLNFDYSSIGNFFTEQIPFSGVYDGNGKTISNISANAPLFNYVGAKGQIKNLKMKDCSVVAERAAILVNYNYGKITNCQILGTTSSSADGDAYAALIAVNNLGTITNCFASGAVSGRNECDNCDVFMGGLVAYNSDSGKIINCTAQVNCSSSWASNSCFNGGIVGVNDGLVNNCEANGTLESRCNIHECHHKGGIAGLNNSQIIDCSYTGTSDVNIAGENSGIVA